MKANNPMRRPEIAAKVALNHKLNPKKLADWHIKKLADLSRKRMMGDGNPMRNPQVAMKVATKNLLARGTSKYEDAFWQWVIENNLPIEKTSTGEMWIGRRNPDFRVPNQKKCIELTQNMCFIGYERRIRTMDSYAIPSIQHYNSKGWNCLVIYGRSKQRFKMELAQVILDYASPESNWSGVWNYKELIRSDAKPVGLKCSTLPATQTSLTRPMAS